MFARAILLIEVFSLMSVTRRKGYSIMDMHSIDCETSSWSDVKISRNLVHSNESCKVASFMTLTEQVLFVTRVRTFDAGNTVPAHIARWY